MLLTTHQALLAHNLVQILKRENNTLNTPRQPGQVNTQLLKRHLMHTQSRLTHPRHPHNEKKQARNQPGKEVSKPDRHAPVKHPTQYRPAPTSPHSPSYAHNSPPSANADTH